MDCVEWYQRQVWVADAVEEMECNGMDDNGVKQMEKQVREVLRNEKANALVVGVRKWLNWMEADGKAFFQAPGAVMKKATDVCRHKNCDKPEARAI